MSEWRITRLRGEFCITWDEPGDIRRRYRLGTDDLAEAHRRAPARYAELTRPKGRTVADLWQGYCKDRTGRAVLVTMKYTWLALKARFGSMTPNRITVDDCRAHTAERHAAGIQDGTIYTELGHLRMVLLWAEKTGSIERAPHIERPPKPEPKDRYLTRPEMERLLDCTKNHHIRLAILLFIGTAARNAAALELTWDRVDFERRMIQLRNPFDKTRRKGRATVPINDGLMAALTEARGVALTPFVIEWAGQPVKSIKRGLASAATAAGLDHVSPHVFRHSAAVWLAEDGQAMDEISQFLGHANVAITVKTYARYSPEYLRGLANSLEIRSSLRFSEPENRNK